MTSSSHGDSSNGGMIVAILVLFFIMSLVGHYVFIIRDGGHELPVHTESTGHPPGTHDER